MEEPKEQEQEQNQNPEPNLQTNQESDINLDLDTPPEPAVPVDQPKAETEVTPNANAPVFFETQPKKRFNFSKKQLLVGALTFVGVLLIAGVAWAYFAKDTNKQAENNQTPKVSIMGAELSIADGTVQKSTDNKTWQVAKVGDKVSEGNYIKTLQDGRAVVALDDGSAIRINKDSVIKIDGLDVTNVVVTNVSGEVYTRIVKSDRKFSVNMNGEYYTAMGTAYNTVNTSEVKGVEVYESKVKLTKANLEVPEGKYYYNASKDATQINKLADIPIDAVKQDPFMAWNYEQDKKSSEFKDKLGYLGKAYETTATPTPTTPKTTAVGVNLTGAKYSTGVKLTWSLSNVSAPKGFKIVKSLAANPTYGKDDYQYVSDPNTRSYAWTIKDGKTWHFRVCVYNGSGCSTYSNDIAVTAPYTAETEPSGTLDLTKTGGKNFSWTVSGYAPKGYKLVWSTTANPVYPGSEYEYYSDPTVRNGTINPSTSGTYHVRVCMYTGSGCNIYSDEEVVTIP